MRSVKLYAIVKYSKNEPSQKERTMNGVTQRINALVKGEGLTCAQLGSLLGLSKTSANGKLLGRIGWTTSDIVVLSEHFRVSTDYLLGLDADHEEVA